MLVGAGIDRPASTRNSVAYLAMAGLVVLCLACDLLIVGGLRPTDQAGAWRLLAASALAGAIALGIMAIVVRNPDGTVITRDPSIIRQNRLRIRRRTTGIGFGILLGLGLALAAILRATGGPFLVGCVGAFTGFLLSFVAPVAYAQHRIDHAR